MKFKTMSNQKYTTIQQFLKWYDVITSTCFIYYKYKIRETIIIKNKFKRPQSFVKLYKVG